ncbi:alpha,alpha-trehalose-phosphate synthase [UDP-forming] 1 [Tanacetum coccineum]
MKAITSRGRVLEDASPRKDEINKDKSKCGRINGRFGTLTTVPIYHLDRSLDFLALCALYAVTGTDPLPLYITKVAASIGQALTMSAEEREKRHLHNFLHVTTHTAQNWAETFVSEMNDTELKHNKELDKFHRQLPFEEAIEQYIASSNRLLYYARLNYCESAVVTASVNAVEMINPLNEHAIILVKKVESEEHFHEVRKPSLNIHTYIPKANSEGELQVKILLTYENPIYILSSRARTMWDISLINVKITIPWENGMSEMHRLINLFGPIYPYTFLILPLKISNAP